MSERERKTPGWSWRKREKPYEEPKHKRGTVSLQVHRGRSALESRTSLSVLSSSLLPSLPRVLVAPEYTNKNGILSTSLYEELKLRHEPEHKRLLQMFNRDEQNLHKSLLCSVF